MNNKDTLPAKAQARRILAKAMLKELAYAFDHGQQEMTISMNGMPLGVAVTINQLVTLATAPTASR